LKLLGIDWYPHQNHDSSIRVKKNNGGGRNNVLHACCHGMMLWWTILDTNSVLFCISLLKYVMCVCVCVCLCVCVCVVCVCVCVCVSVSVYLCVDYLIGVGDIYGGM